ncbi:MAG TPA: hypothetical protein VIE39_06020, partial [Thermoanaerobaculia bacterium]
MSGSGGFLQGLLDSRLLFADLPGGRMEDALAEMSHRIVAAGIPADEDELSRRLLEREKLGCTG